MNFEGDSGSNFGHPQTASEAKNLDFDWEVCSKSKVDLFAPERLRGQFWMPKWSQNGDQNLSKIYKKSTSEFGGQKWHQVDPPRSILEAKIAPKRLPKSMKIRVCVADAFLERFGAALGRQMVDFGNPNHQHIIKMVPKIYEKSTSFFHWFF